MQLAIIGLGKMGRNMAARLAGAGHEVVAFDVDPKSREAAEAIGARAVSSLEEAIVALSTPRVVWLMLPAGEVTDEAMTASANCLSRGDILVDGANSYFRDTLRRSGALGADGIHLVDVGTSGGIWGLEGGYSLMVGGDPEVVEQLHPILEALAPAADRGWGRVGGSGAGHFVKMVHNGIEYGMMQAFAEGFALMRQSPDFSLDLHQVAEVWRDGSVVRSWLLDLIARALSENPELEGIAPHVSDSGEGRWTVFEAIHADVAAPVITTSLLQRLQSRDDYGYSDRLLAAMRQQFGGHSIKKG